MKDDETKPYEAVEPDLPICDAHVHLWTREGITPPSSNGTWDATGRIPFEPADLVETVAASGHDVRSFVFAECGQGYHLDGQEQFQPVGETEYVTRARDDIRDLGGPDVAAIFGMADLRAIDCLDAVLDDHVDAGQGLFAGVRVRAAHDAERARFQPDANQPPKDLMQDENFRTGLKMLGQRNLKADMWIFHPQLSDFHDLARKVPGTEMVIDHLGAPLGIPPYDSRRTEVLASWRKDMTRLAELPNLHVKLGGLGMYLLGHDWRLRHPPASESEISDFYGGMIHFLVDTFGPERCMFESNFPVDQRSFTYGVFWNACKLITKRYTAQERDWLFSKSALKFYTGNPVFADQ